MKFLLFISIIVLLFNACSGKKYYEPEKVSTNLKLEEKSLNSQIVSLNKIGATLKDNRFININGISKVKLPKDFEFINLSDDGRIIATNYVDKLLIGEETIQLKNVVVAASLKKEKLALVYSDNSMELLDIKTKQTLFKQYLPLSLANDTRIANPMFIGNLILFPSLNGRVVIVSSVTNESVRNIAVDTDGKFNNIIFLGTIQKDDTLILASTNKIVAISSKSILTKDYTLRDIIINNNDIYIATLDGQIIKLDSKLVEKQNKKYKYSKIYALAFSNSLYALESQGFLIKLNPNDFKKDSVYKFQFNNNKKVIAIGNKIYIDSNYFILP